MLTINHSICPECSMGCGLNLISKDGEIVGVNPYKNHPINEGKNCKNSIDNINTIKSAPKISEYDYNQKITESVELLKKYDSNDVTIITSGKTDNADLEKIVDFAQEKDYNIVAYENNFTKIDSELIPTYEDVEKSDLIISIGDVYRNNSLIARRIIHAQQNNAKTININVTDNLAGYNSDEFKKIESYDEIINVLEKIETTKDTIIIINDINSTENYEKIVEYVKEKGIKILTLYKHPNTFSVLNTIQCVQKEELMESINNSKLLLVINEELSEILDDECLENNDIIKLSSTDADAIPIRAWYEKDGSFTNSEGLTQEFEDAVQNEDNQIKTISEILTLVGQEI